MVGFVCAAVGSLVGSLLASRVADAPAEQPAANAPTAGAPTAQPPQNGSPGVIGDLAYHSAYISFSDDPASFDEGTLIAEEASVPDALVCTVDSEACDAGDILVYFVDVRSIGIYESEHIGMIRSTDGGKTWNDRVTITIADKPNPDGVAVDPSLVQLDDGRLRLYYYGPEGRIEDPATATQSHPVYSATSVNGIDFTVEDGARVSRLNLTDPEVVRFDGTWYMYYSLGQTSGVATSEDGLEFEDRGELSVDAGGVPGAIALADGIRIYGCSRTGIQSAFSEGGITFDSPDVALSLGGVCDPSPEPYGDGYLFVYKQIDRP